MSEFSHLDKHGNVKMVDVTDKMTTARMAKAEGKISILPETILAIQDDTLPKGNVLTISTPVASFVLTVDFIICGY